MKYIIEYMNGDGFECWYSQQIVVDTHHECVDDLIIEILDRKKKLSDFYDKQHDIVREIKKYKNYRDAYSVYCENRKREVKNIMNIDGFDFRPIFECNLDGVDWDHLKSHVMTPEKWMNNKINEFYIGPVVKDI
jgi:hypothetical protein